MSKRKPYPLSLKPDLDEANRRWEAFYAGEIIDRPVVLMAAAKPGRPKLKALTYHDRMFMETGALLDRMMERAANTVYLGEAVPRVRISIGTDEIAALCGAEITFSPDSGDTNWSVPYVTDWKKALPLRIDPNNKYTRRIVELCTKAAAKFEGVALVETLDWHTNMDLLMSLRGSQHLCMDLIDQPEMIDAAMASARPIFREAWNLVAKAGKMDERGWAHDCYSMEGATTLQCDFSCMIGPAMFRRWVMPALEEEASIAKHAFYHWDGPDALKHLDDLCTIPNLQTFAYQQGAGHGPHIGYLDVFKRVQAHGRSVCAWGTIDEIKAMHKELKPELTAYIAWPSSEDEGRRLLDWFMKNT